MSLSVSADAKPNSESMAIRADGTISMYRRATGAASSRRPVKASDAA